MNIRERIANWLSPKGTTIHEITEKEHPHIRRFHIRFNKSTKIEAGASWPQIPRHSQEHPTKPILVGFPNHKLLVTRIEFDRSLESGGIIVVIAFYSWVNTLGLKGLTGSPAKPKPGTITPPLPPPPPILPSTRYPC